MSTTPHIKFEDSPTDSLADSFISTPGTIYPPLFPPHDALEDTLDDAECMTPPDDEESLFGGSMRESVSSTPAPEKKPVKKRKSWGQQLPEPKTNLPPRKRAKTEDEKEQRRVERVLRNRRAAQSSRERKRQEVEALEAQKNAIERRNHDLEMRLADLEAKNLMLQRELEQFTGSSNMTVFRGSSTTASPPQRPVTFSQELFAPQDTTETPQMTTQVSPLDSQPSRTVNPASLSPEIRPVAGAPNASSSDLTQHPAAVLCDLQCQSQEQRPWTRPATTPELSQLLAMTMFLSTTSSAISALLTPLSQIITSLRTGSSLSPTTSILTMIMWLLTTTASLTISTSTSSSTTTSHSRSRPRFSLRLSLLDRLLACSPDLARPLRDATTEALRLASEQQLSHDCVSGVVPGKCGRRCCDADSPSLESLMTLLWAIRVFEKRQQQQLRLLEHPVLVPELDTTTSRATNTRSTRVDGNELGGLLRARRVKGGKGRLIFRSANLGQKDSSDKDDDGDDDFGVWRI